jgi:hypothetical protein
MMTTTHYDCGICESTVSGPDMRKESDKPKTILTLPPYPEFYMSKHHEGMVILAGEYGIEFRPLQGTAPKDHRIFFCTGAAMWEEVLSNVSGQDVPMYTVAIDQSIDWRAAAFGRIPLDQIVFEKNDEDM